MEKGWDGYDQRIGKTKILSFGITQETTKHIEGLKEKLKNLGLDKKILTMQNKITKITPQC